MTDLFFPGTEVLLFGHEKVKVGAVKADKGNGREYLVIDNKGVVTLAQESDLSPIPKKAGFRL